MDYIKGTWANDGGIAKLGWLAVALVIFARWKPKHAIWGSYLFGILFWLYFYILGLTRSSQELFKMLPYIVTIIVFRITSYNVCYTKLLRKHIISLEALKTCINIS